MPTNYPNNIDNLSNPSPSSNTDAPSHAGQHTNANDAIEAIQATLGIMPHSSFLDVAARLTAAEGKIVYSESAPSSPPSGTIWIDSDGYSVYWYDGSEWIPIIQTIDFQVFEESGTWNKPANARWVYAEVIGAGGSGGGGAGDADNELAGAGGGGGGAVVRSLRPASSFSDTESVVVGAGGASVTGGSTGNDGGNSSFGEIVSPGGGAGPSGRDSSSPIPTEMWTGGGMGGGGVGAPSLPFMRYEGIYAEPIRQLMWIKNSLDGGGGGGETYFTSAGRPGGYGVRSPGGGGSGGSSSQGGYGGLGGGIGTESNRGVQGTLGGDGQPGTNATTRYQYGGGGGGGAKNTGTSSGGDGGAGGVPGGGGGGAAPRSSDSANAAVSGAGGRGEVRVWSW